MDFQHALHIFNTLYEDLNGYMLSSLGRAQISTKDKAFTYGEVSPEAFYSILNNLPSKPKGKFYDLGSGTGKAIILAHMLFKFSHCIGIELLTPLNEAALGIKARYLKEYKNLINAPTVLEFVEDDFLAYDFSDADLVFMHSTCFPEYIWKKLLLQFEKLKEGTYVLAVTRTIHSNSLEHIKSKEYGMAWGRATVHYYRKI